MELFIIGNGFDIGHDLPTKYWDFRTYLKNIYPDFLHTFEERYYISSIMSDVKEDNLLWSDLEGNLAKIDEDVIIEESTNIDMGLEGGDIGIEDTLFVFFSNQYKYIEQLAGYLKQWVKTIKIRDVQKKSSLITDDSMYITFNYTGVLEKTYGISQSKIIHIHGSIRQKDIDPVLGHGDQERIKRISEKIEKAEYLFDEKRLSIYRVIKNYYQKTFKDVKDYSQNLYRIDFKDVEGISVVGHSLASIDGKYFNLIDQMSERNLIWKIYYYHAGEKERLKNNLIDAGVEKERIELIPSLKFYDL